MVGSCSSCDADFVAVPECRLNGLPVDVATNRTNQGREQLEYEGVCRRPPDRFRDLAWSMSVVILYNLWVIESLSFARALFPGEF